MTGHVYLSTACLHAVTSKDRVADSFHRLCRLACKYCQAPCYCPCHDRDRREAH